MTGESKGMTYKDTGVDYDAMDPFKRIAQLAGRETAKNLGRPFFCEVEMSRGESCYLIETPDSYLAHVEEGLGTKCLVADVMYKLTGKSYYDQIAQDTVAMIVNDMITLGALPLSVAMHLAVGDSNWFNDEMRAGDLVRGWKNACDLARCAWGGGETPTLKDIVIPGAVVLSGSAMGIVRPKERLIRPGCIQHGDVIIIFESSGIHANALTLARSIGERIDPSPTEFPAHVNPKLYLKRLDDGRTFGETLLDPTHIYVPVIEDLLNAGIDIHYAVNITGHGWRKLMRATQPFAYVIDELPRQHPVFSFIQKHGPVDDREAYGNLNMGAGFALYVPESDMDKVEEAIRNLYNSDNHRFRVYAAGHVEKSDQKKVIIKPVGLEYAGDTLGVR